MNQSDTRQSLLLRIRNADDRDAWDEFSSIYRPAIVSVALQRGLQNADAEDLAQKVLVSVARAIANWNPDPERAQFRTWLHRITTNAVINAISRRKPDQGSGNESVQRQLEQCPASETRDSQSLTIEVRREVFRFAAKKIRHRFHDDTWQAFWLTSVDGVSIDDARRQLNMSAGSVYAARSRVMRQLKKEICSLQILEEENDA